MHPLNGLYGKKKRRAPGPLLLPTPHFERLVTRGTRPATCIPHTRGQHFRPHWTGKKAECPIGRPTPSPAWGYLTQRNDKPLTCRHFALSGLISVPGKHGWLGVVVKPDRVSSDLWPQVGTKLHHGPPPFCGRKHRILIAIIPLQRVLLSLHVYFDSLILCFQFTQLGDLPFFSFFGLQHVLANSLFPVSAHANSSLVACLDASPL